ncbi:MAG: hypothetical protein DBY25_03430 [Clostridiales bacterium]|nr:MAG: hypothetical protein DBY25_03430 [Clostridiales bacterium]
MDLPKKDCEKADWSNSRAAVVLPPYPVTAGLRHGITTSAVPMTEDFDRGENFVSLTKNGKYFSFKAQDVSL